jgi:hypothetical protein
MFGTAESIGVKCQGPVAAGWLTHLYLIKCEDVAFDVFPDSVLRAMNPLWLAGAKVVTEIRLRSKTVGFTESLQPTANGSTYPYQISVPVPALATELTQWVYQNANRRFVAIFRDTAGSCYMAGTKTNGCRLSWSRSVQQVSAQQMQLSGINWFPLLWLDTVDPELLFPTRKEFDYSFDLSFS